MRPEPERVHARPRPGTDRRPASPAQRFGATVVPFGAVGIDDGINMLLDTDDLLSMPFVADRAMELPVPSQRRRVREARAGAGAPPPRGDDLFLSPLSVPRDLSPQRMYFLFGRPIALGDAPARDGAEADLLYRRINDEVDGAIAYLLREREKDEYGDFGRRIAYELLTGAQAPSFRPVSR